jgi:putative spermidine/putrescine transport system permease protein
MGMATLGVRGRLAGFAPHLAVTVFVLVALVSPLLLVTGSLVRDAGEPLSAETWPAAVRTVVLALGVAAVSLPVAVVIAASLRRRAGWVRALGVLLCGAPMVLNLLVVILSWQVVLEHDGLLATVWSALLPGDPPRLLFTPLASVLAMAYVVVPVMALIVLFSLRRLDPRTIEAARLLGASPVQRFLLVELGSVTPSLVASFIMGYVVCLNLYLVPEYLSGPELTTLGFLAHQDVIKSFAVEQAAARSGVLLVLAIVPVLIASAVERRQRR